ncbi:cytochrome P450 [Bacillus suaedae]|uniref:Cytochrome P450 n=1 Tax=Halalkalibacter suaedae TaxID=2822140 RepID=A0A941AT27_9BACI|nr:cytochrome P450 [Bacillus suaedae]MBP3950714.1 cytochrome P450 [Bacillus suaedae]
MNNKHTMPIEEGFDHSLKLLQEGYQFILNRSHMFHSNVFETKLLAEKTICLTGKETAKLFYDNDKFTRVGAAPKRIEKTLFGQGGVQGLDGDAHRERKGMFMSLMTKESLQEISELTEEEWRKAITSWGLRDDTIVLYDESKKILALVASKWTGIPIGEDIDDWSKELGLMFETAAALGPSHWKGRMARSKIEDRVEVLVKKVRTGAIQPEQDRALYKFSWHRDTNGELVDEKIVAVELINLLRPIVAISVYICFTALAIHHYPEEVEKLKTGDQEHLKRFVQEVRRYYPFFPFTAARVKDDFTWGGYEFEKGTLTLLDLYGTNHHPDDWENPDRFEPDRFIQWDKSPFDFIPQGGGEYDIGHRCAGEWITIDIMKVSLDNLVNKMRYELPEQELQFSMNEIPSLPESKIIIRNVKRK